VIIRDKKIKVGEISDEYPMLKDDKGSIYKNAIFFDLEHYIYKVPICIGVFGCCYYDEKNTELVVTQYMIENKNDAEDILDMAKDYFYNMRNCKEKKYIVTFSGNNDFTVINYLFNKYNIDFSLNENFIHIDLQREYEKETKSNIGLKALEKVFEIDRGSELISGSNLAKTFWKIVKDDDYFGRMPEQKIEKILLYNEQDIVSLFQIYINWNKLNKTDKGENRNVEPDKEHESI
jgi:uncharacterized protein YprB with RNaseH-like and TPR domain